MAQRSCSCRKAIPKGSYSSCSLRRLLVLILLFLFWLFVNFVSAVHDVHDLFDVLVHLINKIQVSGLNLILGDLDFQVKFGVHLFEHVRDTFHV